MWEMLNVESYGLYAFSRACGDSCKKALPSGCLRRTGREIDYIVDHSGHAGKARRGKRAEHRPAVRRNVVRVYFTAGVSVTRLAAEDDDVISHRNRRGCDVRNREWRIGELRPQIGRGIVNVGFL